MKPVRWRPRAKRDAAEAAAWYATQGGQVLELAFIDALHAAEARIGGFPGIGSSRHAMMVHDVPLSLRFHRLQRFERYLVYYLDQPTHVEVMRVWDASRGLDALVDPSDSPPTTEESA